MNDGRNGGEVNLVAGGRCSAVLKRATPTAFLRGDRDGKRPGPATLWADYFPSAAEPPLHREAK